MGIIWEFLVENCSRFEKLIIVRVHIGSIEASGLKWISRMIGLQIFNDNFIKNFF